MKTPFEFVVVGRARHGTDVTNAAPLVQAVPQLGMPLYHCQPPTGYRGIAPMRGSTPARSLNRMNFARAARERPDARRVGQAMAPASAALARRHLELDPGDIAKAPDSGRSRRYAWRLRSSSAADR